MAFEPMLCVKEYASFLNCSEDHVRRLLARGLVPGAIRIDGPHRKKRSKKKHAHWRIPRGAVPVQPAAP